MDRADRRYTRRCGDKKPIPAPARSRTMGTGLMKSTTPGYYGDVPSLSPPVDWIMPNEDAEIVGLHTSHSLFIIYYPYSFRGNFVIPSVYWYWTKLAHIDTTKKIVPPHVRAPGQVRWNPGGTTYLPKRADTERTQQD